MFYSSSEFSHLAPDKTEKLLYAKNQNYNNALLIFHQRKPQMTCTRREALMPFPRWQMRKPQQPPAVSGDTVTPRLGALAPSHPLQEHKDPMVPCPPTHPPEGWAARVQPQLCAGCCHLSRALGRLWQQQGSRRQGVQTRHGGMALQKTCSNCPKSQKFLGLTTVHFLTKKAALYRKRGQD